ncbi:hypothetical protein HDU67_009037 [Dinochytrium kinnereticum]|nr:hypothetical protein HDU67_009037 [Dinochytrium kinnereticum]
MGTGTNDNDGRLARDHCDDIPDAFPAFMPEDSVKLREALPRRRRDHRPYDEDMANTMMDRYLDKSWSGGALLTPSGPSMAMSTGGGGRRVSARTAQADWSLSESLAALEDMSEASSSDALNNNQDSRRPPMFSADRHYETIRADARRRDELGARKEEEAESWASESLQFETLLTENTDDVLMEARQLLKKWVDNDITPADDVSGRVNTKENKQKHSFEGELFLVPTSHQEEIRNIVTGVVAQTQGVDPREPSTFGKLNNPRLMMDARQRMAKEKRESIESQRRADLEQKISERQRRLAIERAKKELELRRYKKDVEDRWRSEVALKEARMKIESDRALKRSQMIESVKSEAGSAEMEVIDEHISREKKELNLQKKKEEDTKRQQVEAKVEELYALKCLKTLRFMERNDLGAKAEHRKYSGDIKLAAPQQGMGEVAGQQKAKTWQKVSRSSTDLASIELIDESQASRRDDSDTKARARGQPKGHEILLRRAPVKNTSCLAIMGDSRTYAYHSPNLSLE